MVTGGEFIIALAIVAVGATVMGSVGFGLGLVVAPVLLLLMEPREAVVLVNGEVGVLTALLLVKTWRYLPWKQSLLMSGAGVVAAPIGVLILDSAGSGPLRIAVAVAVLGLGALIVSNVQIPWMKNPLAGAASGFVAALSITALSIGGPLAAFYAIAQGWEPRQVRASLALYFLTFEIAAFALYAWTGLLQPGMLISIGALLPGVLLGFAVGTRLASRLNNQGFRWVAVAVICTGSLVLLTRELAGL